MKIWSRGLGTMVLTLDFRNYYVECNEKDLLIKGQITDPVFWNFVITIKRDDIKGLANIFFKLIFLIYIGKNLHFFFKFLFEKIFNREKYSIPEEEIEIIKE